MRRVLAAVKRRKNRLSALQFQGLSYHPFSLESVGFFLPRCVSCVGADEKNRAFWMGNLDAIALTENGATALPLVADNATHGDCLKEYLC